jgi:hypothetical protein
MPEMPDKSTYFYKIHIDDKGFLYTYVSDEENKNSQELDIFSPKGEYIYHGELKAPADNEIKRQNFVFGKDFVVVLVEDPDGELKLIKYKVAIPNIS